MTTTEHAVAAVPPGPGRSALASAPLRTLHWRYLPAAQQPQWPEPSSVIRVQDRIALRPALTAPADVRRLGSALAAVRAGESFLLQAGDCAEPVGPAAVAAVRGKHETIGAMAELISERIGLSTVTVGRIGGQHAKPRSQPVERVADRDLPVYRGDLVNRHLPDEESRRSDPERMALAYETSRAVLNELHLLAHEAAAARALRELEGPAPTPVRADMDRDGSLRSVLAGYGQTVRTETGWARTGLWTSHEALVLDYEQPLLRRDARTDQEYLLSTHFPWIGDRTRQVGGAHVAFLAGIANPVACKVGPGIGTDELVELCGRLDPYRMPGRLTLISRMGVRHVRERLPELVRALRRAGHGVVWSCDPMHGNTRTLPTGMKTRLVSDVTAEVTGFLEVLGAEGEWPGGLHLEIAGEEVTECLGTADDDAGRLNACYRTLCDPRLSNTQAMHVVDVAADRLRRL